MVHTFNPLDDRRWPEFVARHPHGSVFHGTGWLDALWRTYGYEPIVYSTSPPGSELANGVLFCRVNSPITGRRLVSLPFTDHCQPLVTNPQDRVTLLEGLARTLSENSSNSRLKYIELRPRHSASWSDPPAAVSESFAFHAIDLRPTLEEIYDRVHTSTVQRKIRRAEREAVSYEAGSSDSLLAKFYHLLLLTRRRHRLPPQPLQWFQNLRTCMGDQFTIRVASMDEQPIAAILTLTYCRTMVYKYGCSDARHHRVGGMSFLLWKAIQDAKARGMEEFDLGRSDDDNAGLITFKDRWGATRSALTYWRYARSPSNRRTHGPGGRLVRYAFALMPDRVLAATGRLLYRHLG